MSFDLYYAYFQGSRISGPPRDFIEEKSSFYCLLLNETWNACLDGPKLAQKVIKKLDGPKLAQKVIKKLGGPKLAQGVIKKLDDPKLAQRVIKNLTVQNWHRV